MTVERWIPDRLRSQSDTPIWISSVLLFTAGLLILLAGIRLGYPPVLLVLLEVVVFFLLYAIITLSVNLQFGFTGIVNFGPVLFFAVGGYTTAMVASSGSYQGITFGLAWPVALGLGVLMAILTGVILALSSIQLRGDFLAVVTLAAAEIFHQLTDTVRSIFGGDNGISNVPQVFSATDPQTTIVVVILMIGGILMAFYGIINRLTGSPYGRVLRAIKADETTTRSLGKQTFRYKLQVFIYGSAAMGLAGGLFALFNGAISPGFTTLDVTVLVWIGMLIGGAGNNRGVLGGLAIIMGLQLFSRFANQIFPGSSTQFAATRLMVIGLLLILIIRYRPAGIWGDPREMEAVQS